MQPTMTKRAHASPNSSAYDYLQEREKPAGRGAAPGMGSRQRGSPLAANDGALPGATMQDLEDAGILLPAALPFKRIQLAEKYPKGQARGRHWKHLKQMLQAENYHLYPADEPNYMNIEAPPSMYPAKKYCDITGFEAPYTDPRTKLHFANTEVFKQIRSLPNESVQQYLAMRNAQVVLK